MECPSCFELFDLNKKIARNLPCGHSNLFNKKLIVNSVYSN